MGRVRLTLWSNREELTPLPGNEIKPLSEDELLTLSRLSMTGKKVGMKKCSFKCNGNHVTDILLTLFNVLFLKGHLDFSMPYIIFAEFVIHTIPLLVIEIH